MDKFRFASVPGVKRYLNIFSRYVMEQEIGKQREIGRRKRRERRGKNGGRLCWAISANSRGRRVASSSCFDERLYVPAGAIGYPQFRWTKVAKLRRFGVGTWGWSAAAFGSGLVVVSAE
jgi:hypothetical protein